MSLSKNYLISESIGSGSMGTISKAIQKSLDRFVAVKQIHPHLSKDPQHILRLEREAKSAARLNHMNIMEIIDFGNEDEQYYIVVEYIDGPSLAGIFQNISSLSMDVIFSVIIQMLNGLEHAHNHGIIHRDIKPENIMFTCSGVLKITDFGVARIAKHPSITQEDQNIIGTPYYMAPEQAEGKKTDHRADLFSVGVVLYQMLCNALPFKGNNIATVLNEIIYKPHTPVKELNPDIAEELCNIVERALEKDVTHRFFDAAEFAYALETFAQNAGIQFSPRILKNFFESDLNLSQPETKPERSEFSKSYIGKGRATCAILPLTGCFGCQVNLLDLHEDFQKLYKKLDVRFSYLMDIKEIPKVDIGIVEGCVANFDNQAKLEKLRDSCETLVALGTCACFGGIPGLRNFHGINDVIQRAYLQSESTVKLGTIPDSPEIPSMTDNVHPLSDIVKIDYKIPGCPSPPHMVLETIDHLIKGTEPEIPTHTLCYECTRTRKEMLNPRREFIADKINPIMELEKIDPETCFLEQGVLCMGITTRSGCNARCLKNNIPCQGCMGPGPHVRETGAKWINALGSLLPGGSMRFRHDLVGIGYCYTLPISMMPFKK
ncbi:protein kinase [Desulfobacterales bacterium HSG17]|nr:protein kinase [Desulfobacterales bacterium HSG17]